MIEFKDVSKVYPNGVVGLDNVNLKIEQGEFVAIIGLSGAGKSTLLRTINRMHDITSGTLTVDGLEVKNLKGKELRTFRRKIGMIFQSFNLVTRTTVIRNVLMAKVPEMPFWRVLLGVFKKEDKMQALESLDKVGILDKAYIRADQLSGGQQQRVALARTLAQNPEIILADEPVAALDPVTAKQVMSDFRKINQDMNISILINIHHVELALEYADRIIGIRAGKIVYDGPSENVTQDVLIELYKTDKAFESDAHLKNWLIRVTVNRCKMLFRSPWRRHEDIDDYAETLSFEQPRDGELFEAVMALERKYRVPLLLFYYEGYSTAEIASMLSIAEKTVSTRLYRARAKLRTILEEE